MKNDKIIRVIYPILIKQTKISIEEQLKSYVYSQLTKLGKVKDVDFICSQNSIPINRLNYSLISYPYSVTYRCTIAFQLASRSSYPAIILAEEIFEWIKQNCSCFSVEDRQGNIEYNSNIRYMSFTFKLIKPGWLEFILDDKCLLLWLRHQYISRISTYCTIYSNKLCNSLQIVQYAYARSCDLLDLAKEQGIITGSNINFLNHQKTFKNKDYIFSYDIELKQLLLNSYTERQLISQIFTVLDSQVNKSEKDNIKQTLILSYYLLEFERSCRIFPFKKSKSIEKSQARLGLIVITQGLLQKVCFNKP
ncbi:MAG: hypothetical protein ucyna2_01051 [Candidatus Atelocyanobacterium thalassa isolate SIO64986]|uniref:DALR anticodon binding domain-containing protein n=1 Tax=Candidatus Atelocyanobacterium thalassa isolate SIO64986 TaxID=1527444 RepID=A0A086CG30_9CHRO|nr:MAG: hypothetical protein ucyna2_01051 [Candidatus Atelocyanobacterium thalassa isolate SIO64986]